MLIIVLVPYVFHMLIFVIAIYLGGSYREGIMSAWTVISERFPAPRWKPWVG